ncbi:MAG: hypothetical protein IJE46_04190 [Clostridia bacterium]|nr:hypothetical protein [Clostridia bacterium]
MWTVIFVTDEIDVAKNIKQTLEELSVKVRIKKRISKNNEPGTYEILVPEAEVSLALAQIS